MKNTRIVLKFKKVGDSKGYLRISSRVGNKTILRSLKLPPIEKRHFNPKTQRLRVSFSKHEEYNNYIENTISNIVKKGNSRFHLNDDKSSFLLFIDKVVNRTENLGTKRKYQNLRNLLTTFTEERYNEIDVRFSDVNHDFLSNLKTWMIKRELQNNTITYKFKGLKALLNKAINERLFLYDFHPFSLIKNNLIDSDVTTLTADEIRILIDSDIKEVYRGGKKRGKIIEDEKVLNDIRYRKEQSLNDIRNYFLFQIFCNGIRISDLLTLRWNDLSVNNNEIRLKKRMIKTKKIVNIFINYNSINYLKNYIPVGKLPNELVQKINLLQGNNSKNRNENNEEHKIKINLDEKFIKTNNLNFDYNEGVFWVSLNDVANEIKNRVSSILNKLDFTNEEAILLYNYNKNKIDNNLNPKKKIEISLAKKDNVILAREIKNDEVLNYLNELKVIIGNQLTIINNDVTNTNKKKQQQQYYIYADIINYLSQSEFTKNDFCFPILKNKDFESIDEKNDFNRMSELQYTKFQGQRSYYGILLKYVIKQCGINKSINPHSARHSFASLMVENGENLNLYELMDMLGHSDLKSTSVYIQKFKNTKGDDLNKFISDKLHDRTK